VCSADSGDGRSQVMGGAKDPERQVGVAISEMTGVSGEMAKQTIIMRTNNV